MTNDLNFISKLPPLDHDKNAKTTLPIFSDANPEGKNVFQHSVSGNIVPGTWQWPSTRNNGFCSKLMWPKPTDVSKCFRRNGSTKLPVLEINGGSIWWAAFQPKFDSNLPAISARPFSDLLGQSSVLVRRTCWHNWRAASRRNSRLWARIRTGWWRKLSGARHLEPNEPAPTKEPRETKSQYPNDVFFSCQEPWPR